MKWQPIETAPKDGRVFLCWVSYVRYGEDDCGQQCESESAEPDFGRWCNGVDGNGYFEHFAGRFGDAEEITHWAPVIAPQERAAALAERARRGWAMRSDNMPRPFAPEHGEEAAPDLQRDIEWIDLHFRLYKWDSEALSAWQRISARLTPDRDRVARAIQDAHGPMHPDFALALADAAIAAMGETP